MPLPNRKTSRQRCRPDDIHRLQLLTQRTRGPRDDRDLKARSPITPSNPILLAARTCARRPACGKRLLGPSNADAVPRPRAIADLSVGAGLERDLPERRSEPE